MKKLCSIDSIEKDYYFNITIHILLLVVICVTLKLIFFKANNTMFIVLIFSIGILFFIKKYLNLKRSFKNIPSALKVQLNEELKTPILTRDDCILTENNLVILNTYLFDYVSYNDIILIYKKMVLNKRSLDQNLCVLTKKNKIFKFPIYTSAMLNNIKLDDFTEIIIKKNPNVLINKTKQNLLIIEKKYKIKL